MPLRKSRISKLLPLFVSLILPLGTTGCLEHIASVLPSISTPATISSGLKALDDPKNKARLEHILATPEIKVIQRELVADVLDGSLAALSERERVDRVGDLTARYAASIMRGLSKESAPQLAPATSAAMRGVMSATLSDDNQRQMQHLVGALVQASMDPVVKSLADADLSGSTATAMTKLGPVVQQVLRENLGPGLAQALSSDEVKHALGETAHVLGREMVLGANEGLARVQENKTVDDSSLLGSVSSLARQGATATRFAPWILTAVTFMLIAWVIRLLGQTRRYRTESEQRAETTRVLTEAIRAADGKPWSGELLTALEARFHNDEEALLRIQAARLRPAAKRSNTLNGSH